MWRVRRRMPCARIFRRRADAPRSTWRHRTGARPANTGRSPGSVSGRPHSRSSSRLSGRSCRLERARLTARPSRVQRPRPDQGSRASRSARSFDPANEAGPETGGPRRSSEARERVELVARLSSCDRQDDRDLGERRRGWWRLTHLRGGDNDHEQLAGLAQRRASALTNMGLALCRVGTYSQTMPSLSASRYQSYSGSTPWWYGP
jgi:hypothetical protein